LMPLPGAVGATRLATNLKLAAPILKPEED
jgi:hypothetical protein